MPITPFLGQIMPAGFNYPPRGWAFCNGQILPIAQSTALFSLLGTQYGGDGRTTFALPNLQSCVPIGMGQGPGLSNYDIGQQGGAEIVSLEQSQMPAHTHGAACFGRGVGDSASPSGNVWAGSSGGDNLYQNPPSASASTANPATTATGSGQPHTNLQPYLTLNFVIALQGVYPSRQ